MHVSRLPRGYPVWFTLVQMAPEHIESTTRLGKLKGLVLKSTGHCSKTYYSFQGIPYAKPPLGQLRFKAPVPFGKWEGVRDATKEGDCTVQPGATGTVGDENCLFLNVYTPQRPGEGAAKMAVMVWIHGGGFTTGSGSTELFGPDYLVDRGVVLVTINYRCGALGFLSLENDKAPGNAGLKDQSMALRWVQDNIDSFGGDPGNVTIFGASAGGASVSFHLLSPLSKGLFHKAIVQSGSSLCQWALQTRPKEKALLLAKELGCPFTDPDQVLEFLKAAPADELVKAQGKSTLSSNKEDLHTFSLAFAPCVERAGEYPFLPNNPRKMMEWGDFSQVPVIIGATDKEGLIALALRKVFCEEVTEDPSLMVPINLDIAKGSEEERQLGKEILHFYTGKETLSWDEMHGYIDFVSDVAIMAGLDDCRQWLVKYNSCPVYTYLLTYTTPRALSAMMLPEGYSDKSAKFIGCGAGHGDEFLHLFKSNLPHAPFVPPPADDQAFMNKMQKSWTNFAKTGDPNSTELGADWKSESVTHPHFLELGREIKTVNGHMFPKRMSFWNKLYEKYSYVY